MRIKRWQIIIIAILMFVVLLYALYGRRVTKEEEKIQREKAFISKVINSINDSRDFHEEYISSDNVSRIKPYISKNYEIVYTPADFGDPEYIIIFDKKYQIGIYDIDMRGDYFISIVWIDWYDNNAAKKLRPIRKLPTDEQDNK